jgi:hypothetical protein
MRDGLKGDRQVAHGRWYLAGRSRRVMWRIVSHVSREAIRPAFLEEITGDASGNTYGGRVTGVTQEGRRRVSGQSASGRMATAIGRTPLRGMWGGRSESWKHASIVRGNCSTGKGVWFVIMEHRRRCLKATAEASGAGSGHLTRLARSSRISGSDAGAQLKDRPQAASAPPGGRSCMGGAAAVRSRLLEPHLVRSGNTISACTSACREMHGHDDAGNRLAEVTCGGAGCTMAPTPTTRPTG